MNLPILNQAVGFAATRHGKQARKSTGLPYITHLFRVTDRVAHYCLHIDGDMAFKMPKDELLACAMLHDVLEDTETTFDELQQVFGQRIALIVQELTKPHDNMTKQEKYDYLSSFQNKRLASRVIKVADRYCNVMDFSRTPGKKNYTSKYALQAYPVYRAYLSYPDPISSVIDDIKELDNIIRWNYDISAFEHSLNKIVSTYVT